MTGADPYRVLGLAYGSDDDAIRSAWRREARRWHPDSSSSPCVLRYGQAQEAYRTLIDPARRRRADERRLDARYERLAQALLNHDTDCAAAADPPDRRPAQSEPEVLCGVPDEETAASVHTPSETVASDPQPVRPTGPAATVSRRRDSRVALIAVVGFIVVSGAMAGPSVAAAAVLAAAVGQWPQAAVSHARRSPSTRSGGHEAALLRPRCSVGGGMAAAADSPTPSVTQTERGDHGDRHRIRPHGRSVHPR